MAHTQPDIETGSILKKLRIIKIIAETAEAKTFVLQPLEGWLPDYQPGQFITLLFFTKHGEKRRSFSISSALNEPLSITVKKVDNGEFSRPLIYTAKVGDQLFSTGIAGFFILPKNDSVIGQYFFLAAGSGITPCFSLIKTILQNSDKKVVLIYSNRFIDDCIFYTQLKQLADKYPSKFELRFLFSDLLNVTQGRLSSWLLTQLLKEYNSSSATQFYLCGPYSYMQMAEITLKVAGVNPANINKENFSNLPRVYAPKPPDLLPHTVIIKIHGNAYTLQVGYPHTILAAAKAQNISLPYSCEAGRCGSCTASCTKGTIWMAYNEVLMDDEIAKGKVLTCQGYPINGDAEIVF